MLGARALIPLLHSFRYGSKQQAVALLTEWVNTVGKAAGLDARKSHIHSGLLGVPESRIEVRRGGGVLVREAEAVDREGPSRVLQLSQFECSILFQPPEPGPCINAAGPHPLRSWT